jgi:hypothetical protein
MKSTNQTPKTRVKQLQKLITKIKRKIKNIDKKDEVAPPTSNVIPYQIRQNKKLYSYYKLQSKEAIFPKVNQKDKLSKYLYLGKAGSLAYIEAVEQVTRRALIDELERTLNNLNQAYLDVLVGAEVIDDPAFYPDGEKKDI